MVSVGQGDQTLRFVVLGAGVIGLQTALLLLEQGVHVTIISESWPVDSKPSPSYTSMWSGAQWCASFDADSQRRDWCIQSFYHWLELVKKHLPEECGVQLKNARYYWDRETYESRDPVSLIWWSEHVEDFTVLPKDDLPIHKDGCVNGIAYKTFCINPRLYLQFLLSSCIKLGAECCTQHVASLSALLKALESENVRAIVNCVGLGAGALVCDASVFPTKGEVVIVKGHAEHAATRLGNGFEAVVIPRPGADETLLGGCRIENDWSPDADEATTQTILDRCRSIAPDLLDEQGDFKVLRVEVGLRPSRDSGPRIEIEKLHRGGRGEVQFPFICHNYGHHSSGFEYSLGTARKAVDLVLEYIEASIPV